jgi:hypothetical protein
VSLVSKTEADNFFNPHHVTFLSAKQIASPVLSESYNKYLNEELVTLTE